MLVPATKMLTAKRLQFFGMITSEYRDQIKPVNASPVRVFSRKHTERRSKKKDKKTQT